MTVLSVVREMNTAGATTIPMKTKATKRSDIQNSPYTTLSSYPKGCTDLNDVPGWKERKYHLLRQRTTKGTSGVVTNEGCGRVRVVCGSLWQDPSDGAIYEAGKCAATQLLWILLVVGGAFLGAGFEGEPCEVTKLDYPSNSVGGYDELMIENRFFVHTFPPAGAVG